MWFELIFHVTVTNAPTLKNDCTSSDQVSGTTIIFSSASTTFYQHDIPIFLTVFMPLHK